MVDPQFPHSDDDSPKPDFDIVAIAASAGGLQVIKQLLGALPANFPVPIVLVQHIAANHPSMMAEILRRHTALQVQLATVGSHLQPGNVYLAPPDKHLLVDSQGQICLSESPLVHFVRPAADLLFTSVAHNFPGRAIAIVLTGMGADGAQGCKAIKEEGGTIMVQDPDTAEYAAMPTAAIETGVVDFVLPLPEIAPKLLQLAKLQAP